MQRYPQTYLQELKEFIHDFESMLTHGASAVKLSEIASGKIHTMMCMLKAWNAPSS